MYLFIFFQNLIFGGIFAMFILQIMIVDAYVETADVETVNVESVVADVAYIRKNIVEKI